MNIYIILSAIRNFKVEKMFIKSTIFNRFSWNQVYFKEKSFLHTSKVFNMRLNEKSIPRVEGKAPWGAHWTCMGRASAAHRQRTPSPHGRWFEASPDAGIEPDPPGVLYETLGVYETPLSGMHSIQRWSYTLLSRLQLLWLLICTLRCFSFYSRNGLLI